MANFDGEYELRFFYTTTITAIALEHRLTFDIDVVGVPSPGDEFDTIEVQFKGGGSETLDLWITNRWLPVWRAVMDIPTDIIRAELWYAEEASFDFIFIGVMPLGYAGLSANPAQVAQQLTATYRSASGGVGRIQIMESVVGGNSLVSFPTSNAAVNAIMAQVTGPNSIVLARDNSRPVVANKLGLGQNEKLYRARFR